MTLTCPSGSSPAAVGIPKKDPPPRQKAEPKPVFLIPINKGDFLCSTC